MQGALESMQHAIGLQRQLPALHTKGLPPPISMATYESCLAAIYAARTQTREAAEAWHRAVGFYADLQRGGYLGALT